MPSPLRSRALTALAALCCCTPVALAQQKPPAPNPQAPTLKPVAPCGMQRGTTLELTLTGTNLAEPTGLWTSFPAKVTIPADANNGKDNAKLRVRLEVPKDAPLGFHALRLATRRGMSNLRVFCIDDLPQVAEVAANTNRSFATAQPLAPPCVVAAKADAEVTDFFKVTAAAGQRLSFEVLGRRLGSAFDPQLTLYDARGRELPGGHSNDAPGCQTDPRLTYTFGAAGDYFLAVRDVSYRGGDDFYYRLRVGDFPCATAPLPMAAKRGSKVAVRFAGPAVGGVAPVEVNVPSHPAVEGVQVAPKGPNGLHGWPVMLAVSDLDELVEKEPNNEPAKANRVPVPGAITGRFEQKGDVDHFVFAFQKGKRYVLEVHTHEHLSPTEVYLVLRDAKGGQLQTTNPMVAPRLDFTAPADGDYTLAVEHLNYLFGPTEAYRLTVTPYRPEFDVSLLLDRFDVAAGGTVSVPVQATRRGYAGPVELSVVGPKGLSGKVTLPAGAANTPKAPPNQPAAALPVSAAADLPPGPLVFHVEAKATIDGKPVAQFATVRTALSQQSFAGLPVPPRTLFTDAGLAVTDRQPFTLAVQLAPSAAPGKPAPLTVTVTRAPGFTGEVALSAAGLPPNVKAALKNVPAGQNTAKAQLDVAPAVKPGQYPITITGKAKHQGRDWAVNAPAVPLVIKK
jgi:hypothetical protein